MSEMDSLWLKNIVRNHLYIVGSGKILYVTRYARACLHHLGELCNSLRSLHNIHLRDVKTLLLHL